MVAEVSFGEWLRRRRKAEGWTQEQLALQISCSTSALKKFEAEERRPSAQIVERLAEIFNIPPNEHTKFLRFARGDWQAISEGDHEDSPWLVAPGRVTKQVETSAPMQKPPSGTVTFLFTDIEGSTKLAQQYPDAMPALLARHHEILNQSIQSHNGYVFQVVGDELAAAFHSAKEALDAALNAQHLLQNEAWSPATIKVRMGIHTGAAQLNDATVPTVYSGYPTLALTQRIMSAAHGGQVLLSDATETLVHGQLPGQVILRDMGEHKFKDVLQPLRVFQVIAPDLQNEFPALRALEVFPNNLPAQLTSFVGRSKEIEQIKKHVEQYRLVTLTGSGGIGKTRLALQVASELLPDFPEGVWQVELAPLSDPRLVPQAIVNTLGLMEQADRPPLTLLSDFLQDKHILLILDNCEHLIQACAQLTEALLHACPNLHILTTSREALEISGESLYHVPSLITPDLLNITFDILPQYEAVQLFVERAQSAMGDFSLTRDNAHAIAQVCHHLDGIPLALELAAARVKVLRAEEIAVRLDDRFHLLTGGARTALPRHQTLRATIDWSHDLLSEAERVLLRRLSVFAGGWRLEAAESACEGEGIEKREILDLLTHLVNKSLILAERQQGQETRYRMLETIRQYAQEKLWAAGEGELMRQRHLAYFVDLAERAEPNLRAFDMVIWLDRLEAEYDNIRLALEWALESDIEAQLRLASALLQFWHIRGPRIEGIDWLERGLSIETAERGDQPLMASRAMLRGKALNAIGIEIAVFYDFDRAATYLEESLALFRELGSAGKQGMTYALMWLAGDDSQSKSMQEQNLTLFREIGDKFGAAECLMFLDHEATNNNDYDRAITLAEEQLALRRAIGDQDGMATALAALGNLAFLQHDYRRASLLYEETLSIFRALGNKWALGVGLSHLGDVFLWQRKYEQAAKIYEEALAFARDISDRFRIAFYSYNLGAIAWFQGDYARANQTISESLAVFRDHDQDWLSASCMHTLGEIALAQGDDQRAIQWYETELAFGREKQVEISRTFALNGLGKVAWVQGNDEVATKRFEEALRMSEKAGYKTGILLALYGLGRVALSQRDYHAAHAFLTQASEIRLAGASEIRLPEANELIGWMSLKTYGVATASPLEAFAVLAAAQNQMERAARLLGAAESLYAAIHFEMSAKERAEHDQTVAAARAALGEEAFAAAWAEGQAMTMEQAIAHALKEESI